MPSLRYAFAVVVNALLPMAAYRLALPSCGGSGALLASKAALVLWLAIDFARSRHCDALSAVVLAGLVMSWSLPALHPAKWLLDARAVRERRDRRCGPRLP